MPGKYSLVGFKSFAKSTALSRPTSVKELEYRAVPDCTLLLSCCKTATSYRDGYRISCSIVFCISRCWCSSFSSYSESKKYQKDFCASSNIKGLLNCLWWHWLGHMRIMACLPLNSCGPQERKSTQQVSEVLLY